MAEQIVAAVFVVGLLLATVWVLRRKGFAAANPIWKRTRSTGTLQVIERVPLTAQHSLHLVRVGEELVLIGVSPSGCGRIMRVGSVSAANGLRTAV